MPLRSFLPLRTRASAALFTAALAELACHQRLWRPPVRVLVYPYPPYTVPDLSRFYGGIDVLFFRKIIRALGLKPEVPAHVLIYTMVNTSRFGLDDTLVLMANGGFDISLPIQYLQNDALKLVSKHSLKLSPIAAMDKILIIAGKESERSESSSGLLDVLEWQVWALLGLSLGLLKALQALVDRSRVAAGKAKSPGPLILTGWWFASGVVLNVFANSLAISLDRAPKSQPLFSSAAELHSLLLSGQCRFATDSGRLRDFDELKAALRKALRLAAADTDAYPPQVVAGNRWKQANLIVASPQCHVGWTWASAKEGQARLHSAQTFVDLPDLPTSPAAFVYRGGTQFARAFEAMTAKGSFTDVYQRQCENWFRKVIPPGVGVSEASVEESTSKRPLRLGQMGDVFSGTFALGAVALATLVVENAGLWAHDKLRARRKLITITSSV